MDKKKVLAVDDEEDFLEILKLNLEKTGLYDVIVEKDSTKAIHTIRKHMPDIVLLDIIMPDVDGTMIADQMQNDTALSKIPIVFLTATVTKKEVEEHDGMIGKVRFLAKPIDPQELIDCVEENIR